MVFYSANRHRKRDTQSEGMIERGEEERGKREIGEGGHKCDLQ